MQLLQDIFIIEQLQVLSEGKADGPMKIRGVFGRCNEKNNNGRIYPTAVLESQLAKVKPLISERRLCGELDHPSNDTVKLSNASHLITKLDMKGDELIGEAEILRTPAGLTAKALVEGGVKIGISSRGMGTLSEDHNGDKIVNEDFRLVTFDLVADPSTRGAYPGLSESVESKFVKDSQSKLTKESNFVTMLNSKLRDAYKPFLEENAQKGYPGVKGGTAAAEEMEEKKGKKKLTKKQRKLDVEPEGGDGDIDSKDLAKLRGEAFELVKADGHWHRIADAIAEGFGKKVVTEAFDDEVDKESATKLAQREPANDSGSMLSNFRARRQAKKMEIAKAKGAAKGAGILAKGDVEAGRTRQKAKDAAAAGKPVTRGEKVAAGAGKLAKGAEDLARGAAALPGKTIDKAVDVTNAATKAKQANRLARAERDKARGRSAKRKTQRETPAPTKDYKSNEEQPFGAGANRPKEREDSARAYKQIGLVLAETITGTARKSKSGDSKQKQNPHGNAEGKQGALGRTPRREDGSLDKKTILHNMKANMNSQNAR